MQLLGGAGVLVALAIYLVNVADGNQSRTADPLEIQLNLLRQDFNLIRLNLKVEIEDRRNERENLQKKIFELQHKIASLQAAAVHNHTTQADRLLDLQIQIADLKCDPCMPGLPGQEGETDRRGENGTRLERVSGLKCDPCMPGLPWQEGETDQRGENGTRPGRVSGLKCDPCMPGLPGQEGETGRREENGTRPERVSGLKCDPCLPGLPGQEGETDRREENGTRPERVSGLKCDPCMPGLPGQEGETDRREENGTRPERVSGLKCDPCMPGLPGQEGETGRREENGTRPERVSGLKCDPCMPGLPGQEGETDRREENGTRPERVSVPELRFTRAEHPERAVIEAGGAAVRDGPSRAVWTTVRTDGLFRADRRVYWETRLDWSPVSDRRSGRSWVGGVGVGVRREGSDFGEDPDYDDQSWGVWIAYNHSQKRWRYVCIRGGEHHFESSPVTVTSSSVSLRLGLLLDPGAGTLTVVDVNTNSRLCTFSLPAGDAGSQRLVPVVRFGDDDYERRFSLPGVDPSRLPGAVSDLLQN